jgi:hypothetical protein
MTTSEDVDQVLASSTNTLCQSLGLIHALSRPEPDVHFKHTFTTGPAIEPPSLRVVIVGSRNGQIPAQHVAGQVRDRPVSGVGVGRSRTKASAFETPAWTAIMPVAWCTSARSSITGMAPRSASDGPRGQHLAQPRRARRQALRGGDFSVTARQDQEIRAASYAIDEVAWTPTPYRLSSLEVSGAVAETSYTAFTGTDTIPVRLIVRRGPTHPRS